MPSAGAASASGPGSKKRGPDEVLLDTLLDDAHAAESFSAKRLKVSSDSAKEGEGDAEASENRLRRACMAVEEAFARYVLAFTDESKAVAEIQEKEDAQREEATNKVRARRAGTLVSTMQAVCDEFDVTLEKISNGPRTGGQLILELSVLLLPGMEASFRDEKTGLHDCLVAKVWTDACRVAGRAAVSSVLRDPRDAAERLHGGQRGTVAEFLAGFRGLLRNDDFLAAAAKIDPLLFSTLAFLQSQANADLCIPAPTLETQKRLVSTVVSANGLCLQHAGLMKMTGEKEDANDDWDPRDDPEIVKTAVHECFAAVEFASESLRADRAFMLHCCSNEGGCGLCLQYASKELRDDKEVVLAAVTSTGTALAYASDRLRASSKKVVMAACTSYGPAVRHIKQAAKSGENAGTDGTPDLLNDPDIGMVCVKHNGYLLNSLGEKLRGSAKPLLLQALRTSGKAVLQFVPKTSALLKDPEVRAYASQVEKERAES